MLCRHTGSGRVSFEWPMLMLMDDKRQLDQPVKIESEKRIAISREDAKLSVQEDERMREREKERGRDEERK